MFDRLEAIKALVDADMDSFFGFGIDTLYFILEKGFKGYDNFTDEELVDELRARDISELFGENDD